MPPGKKQASRRAVKAGATPQAPGWAVNRYSQTRESLIFLGTFGIYGLLQPAIPFLQNPWLGLMLQTGTSVFKALCAGVVIYSVLREVWEEKGEQYTAAQL